MVQTPVVQVRLSAEQIAFLDARPGSRSDALRECIDFTRGAHMTPGQIDKAIADAIVTVGEVPMPPNPAPPERSGPYRFTVEECDHKWRDATNRCRLCGHQR